MKTLSITIVLALAGTAYADQCEWIDAKVAAKAQKQLASHPKVIAFCEPCGEKAPGLPEVVSSVQVSTADYGRASFAINGTDVDLAYTFVQTSPGTYTNLAKLAGCEATGVSRTLKVADETPNGVLITPDDPPPAPPPQPAFEPQPLPLNLTIPAATPPPQIVVLETRPAFPWAMAALALVTGFGATLAGVLAVDAVRRRRRPMRARAAELPRDS
jgi:hypothetical protein